MADLASAYLGGVASGQRTVEAGLDAYERSQQWKEKLSLRAEERADKVHQLDREAQKDQLEAHVYKLKEAHEQAKEALDKAEISGTYEGKPTETATYHAGMIAAAKEKADKVQPVDHEITYLSHMKERAEKNLNNALQMEADPLKKKSLKIGEVDQLRAEKKLWTGKYESAGRQRGYGNAPKFPQPDSAADKFDAAVKRAEAELKKRSEQDGKTP